MRKRCIPQEYSQTSQDTLCVLVFSLCHLVQDSGGKLSYLAGYEPSLHVYQNFSLFLRCLFLFFSIFHISFEFLPLYSEQFAIFSSPVISSIAFYLLMNPFVEFIFILDFLRCNYTWMLYKISFKNSTQILRVFFPFFPST